MVRLGERLTIDAGRQRFTFNSSMVRLGEKVQEERERIKLLSIPAWYDWELWSLKVDSITPTFNSSMVRLGVSKVTTTRKDSTCFQFQHGTIGRMNKIGSYLIAFPFNSSMVRLGAIGDIEVAASVRFQFQHGTIGSQFDALVSYFFNVFQFQHGTIGS